MRRASYAVPHSVPAIGGSRQVTKDAFEVVHGQQQRLQSLFIGITCTNLAQWVLVIDCLLSLI